MQEFMVRFEPRNDSQKACIKAYREGILLFFLGPVGSGKSIAGVALGLQEIADSKSKKKTLYLVRPPVEASSRSIGFLPGDLKEKLEPYSHPVFDLVKKVALKVPNGTLQISSLAHLRGVTFEDCVVLVDECQNLTRKEFELLIGRVGNNCKMIFCGDPEQSDIKATQSEYYTDLDLVVDKLEGVEGVGVVEFDEGDIVRHPLMRGWLTALRK